MAELSLADRIVAVLDHLGVVESHVATQMPADVSDFVAQHGERVGGVSLIAPPRVEPALFAPFGDKLLYVAPEGGMLAKTAASVLPGLPDARTAVLDGYNAESWDDLAKDRPDIADLIIAHSSNIPSQVASDSREASGEIAGIRYRVLGHGPVLLLTPMAFAPSQWEPLLSTLAQRFRVIALSGPKFGMLALVEQRAALQDWQNMCADIFGALNLSSGDRVLDVGCGSGAIAKQFVRATEAKNPLTAVDLSAYFLSEARLSDNEGAITFIEASAEQLPFETDAFEAAYTITVLEECNAAEALAELIRVVKPGGRIAVVVRAIDLPQWWNMPLDDAIKAKIAMPAPSVGDGGVATSRLHDLCRAAGLKPIRQYTYSVASESTEGPVFGFPEMYALSKLSADEQSQFRAAKADALAVSMLFMTRMHHCFVGEVPT